MTTVAELITQQTNAVNALATQADSYLQDLVDSANVSFSNGFNIDDILPSAYNYATVPTVSLTVIGGGIRPNVTDLGLAGPPEVPVLDLAIPTEIALPADDLLAPTNDFTFYEGVYDSTLLDPLKAKLLYDLQNGGYGIDTNDEAALFARAREREVAAAMARIDEAGRAMAARGFPLPPGELSIHIDRAYQDMQDKVSGISREIFVNSAARFVENRKFTITESRELEQITIGMYNSIQERALNTARATAEFSIAVYNALLARYRARVEAARVASEVQRAQMMVEIERARMFVENFRSEIMAYEANVRKSVETAKLQTDLYRVDIEGNRALTDGYIAHAKLQQEVLQATVQQNIQISTMTIEMAKAKLLATVEGLKFRTASVQYGSEKFFALLTALESTINTLAVQTSTE